MLSFESQSILYIVDYDRNNTVFHTIFQNIHIYDISKIVILSLQLTKLNLKQVDPPSVQNK